MNPSDELDIKELIKRMMRYLNGESIVDKGNPNENSDVDLPKNHYFHITYHMNSNMDSPEIKMRGNIDAIKDEELQSNNSKDVFTDIIEKNEEIMIVMEIPGISKEEIDLSTHGNNLELNAGEFQKILELPTKIDENSAKARYTNGILEIRFNKLQSSQKKTHIAID